MSIASRPARSHVRSGVLLSLITASASATGCGNKPPPAAVEPAQQQGVRDDETLPASSQKRARPDEGPPVAAALPPATPATEAKPAVGADGSAKARDELARVNASLQASQAEAARLQRELEAAQKDRRGWHTAYKASLAQVAALQATAAGLKARNDELQRQQIEAATRDAQAGLVGQVQPGPHQGMSEVPGVTAVPSAPPGPAAPAGAGTALEAAPPLGVVRDVRAFRGRPYATVSVGHDAGARRGMRLGLADPRTGATLGVVTLDEVGTAESGGVVEAADPLALRAGLTVHSPADVAR